MFAVTTRNKLRSVRFIPFMIRAWFRVRKQLFNTRGMIRYSTGIQGATEFYTITLWDNEMDMFAFMSSGAHRDMMWNFSKWSDAFWAMRWDATSDEVGSWNTKKNDLAGIGFTKQFDVTLERSEHHDKNYVAEWLETTGISEQLDVADNTPGTPGTAAMLARIPAPTPLTRKKVDKLVKPWREASEIYRLSVCLGMSEVLVIAIVDAGALESMRKMMLLLAQHFPEAWAMRFQGHAYEVGHWDGVRFREILLPDTSQGVSNLIRSSI